MDAGCSMRVSASPKLTAKVHSFKLLRSFAPLARPPLTSKEIMAPGRDICFLATSWPGCSGKPGKMCIRDRVLVSELIGSKPFKFGPVGFTLLPMLYALIIGIILAKMKLITMEMMTTAVPYITISVMYLTAKMSSTVGPNLETVFSAGPALLVTAVTKKLAVPLLAVPVGVLILSLIHISTPQMPAGDEQLNFGGPLPVP